MAISWHLLRFALCARTVCERYWLALRRCLLSLCKLIGLQPRSGRAVVSWFGFSFLLPPNLLFLVSHSLWWQIKSAAGFCLWLGHGNCCTTPGPAACYSARFTTAAAAAVWRSGSFSIKRRTAQTPGAVRKAPVSLPFSLSLQQLRRG